MASIPEIPALPPGVRMVQLPNGLLIIIREDHSAPVVSAQAWCKTGSIHEGKWLGAGLSHVLEHMLFKGTTTRPGSRIDQEVQDAGGYMNAYTSFDRTVFHIDVPNTGAKVAIDILCDIMQNASLPSAELTKELDVIRREMDMNQDDPGRRSGRRLFETAFTRSPYRLTIIGYPDIFNDLKPEDIRDYYRKRYVPNNIFFVVVGDIQTTEVVNQIRNAFSANKARPIAPVVLPSEPSQTAPREIVEEAAVELGYFHFSWHIPDIRDVDMPALDILASVLGTGRSSRLFREVREKKGLVNSVDAWTYAPGELGLFGMSAVVAPTMFEKAKSAMLEEVEKIKTELVPTKELNKVIKQFIVGTLATRKTMQGQAQNLGSNWLAAGNLNFSERYLASAKQVTPQDLQRVAQKYLVADNRTLYALLPEGTAPKKTQSAEVYGTLPVQKHVLPNGLCLLLKEDHRLPLVQYRIAFRGGVLAEDDKTNGLTALMSKMLMQGTQTRTAEQIAGEIESLGGSLETFGGNNSFGATAEVLNSDFEVCLDILADILLHPAFPENALERERRIQIESIRAQRDQLLQNCARLMRQTLFGKTTYGLDGLGSEESVSHLQPQDLISFHRRLTTPNNCVLTIFGDIQSTEVISTVEKIFKDWTPSKTPLPALPVSGPLADIRRVNEERDKKQAVILLGFPGVRISDKDRFALEMLQEACSDLGSRLFLRIRENLGLAYYVGAQCFTGLVPGYFAFYAGTAPEKLKLVEQELLKEVQLLRAEGVTAVELKRAKAKVIGQKKIARQDLGTYAMTVTLDELYGLGYKWIDLEDAHYESVTLDEVKAAANKYLTPEAYVLATVSPEN